jgi:hypothetical protein
MTAMTIDLGVRYVRKAVHSVTIVLAQICGGSLIASLVHSNGTFHAVCLVISVFSALLLLLLIAAGGLHRMPEAG